MPRLRSIPGLILIVACNAGGGGSADGSTSTTAATATDPSSTSVTGSGTTAGTTSGEPMTTSATGTAPTTGPGETSSSSSTTADGSSTGGPGTTGDATTGDATTGDATTGGPVGTCKEPTGDYGPCDALLGYAFVGGSCQLLSGCSCEPDCELFFMDPLACATTCAAAGECQLDNIQGGGVGPDEVGPGSFCDEVDTCVELPELKELFPELTCEPGQPCGNTNCHLLWQGELTAEQWTRICAASLLPGVDELYCMVFGP